MIHSKYVKSIVPSHLFKGKLNINSEQWFMVNLMIVNAGNYAYNLILGRILPPEKFAEASLLVTLLLMLSFMAMSFQITATKFAAEYESIHAESIIENLKKHALRLGLILSLFMCIAATKFNSFFQSESVCMYLIFALSIPLYFLMSVSRGQQQGFRNYFKLSLSYQIEMMVRLILSIGLLWILNLDTGICISLGIIFSIALAYWPVRNKKPVTSKQKQRLNKAVLVFALYTCLYELSQVLINNTDILLVKHYFEAEQTGFYAALAIIGRVVFFISWMFAMTLIPNVIAHEKEGKNSQALLWQNLLYVAILGLGMTSACYCFPNFIISLLFGNAYTEMAGLLWLYALATSLFSIGNLFVYYFLSISRYLPICFTLIFGIMQVISIIKFHDSLFEVVLVQLFLMLTHLLIQIIHHFWYTNKKQSKRFIRPKTPLTEGYLPLNE